MNNYKNRFFFIKLIYNVKDKKMKKTSILVYL
jgi:hypothetical protein